MERNFNKELDNLFDQDEQLLTKEVNIVSDADCDLFCDGDWIHHLIANSPSVIRVVRGKHTFVFKAGGGKRRTRTVEIGDSPISISVSGLKETPSTPMPNTSPQSNSSQEPTQDETIKATSKSQERRLMYRIFGSICGAAIILFLIVKANNTNESTPTSIPVTKPTPSVSNSNASRNAPQTTPSSSASHNSSQKTSPHNNSAKTPSSTSSASKSTETKPTPAGLNSGSLSLSSTDISIIVGDKYTLRASGAVVDRWETNFPTVASVNQNGEITGQSIGRATIRAVSGGIVKTCNVNVVSFTLAPSSLGLNIGEQKTLSANASVDKWVSDNVKVATVNNSGVVTSVGEGQTNIWAYHGSEVKLCKITVTKGKSGQTQTTAPVSSSGFSLRPESWSAKVGDRFALSAGVAVDKWESENEKIATVSSNGVVTCVGVGRTSIWAHHGSELKRCLVTVSGSTNQQSATSANPSTTISVSSTVKDKKGNAVVGATIIVKGTQNGAVADINGKFSLRVPSDAMIEISCSGHKTQAFKATELPNTITLY